MVIEIIGKIVFLMFDEIMDYELIMVKANVWWNFMGFKKHFFLSWKGSLVKIKTKTDW